MRFWTYLRVLAVVGGIAFMALSLLGIVYPTSRDLHCGTLYCDWDTNNPWPFNLGQPISMMLGFFSGLGLLLGGIIFEKPFTFL